MGAWICKRPDPQRIMFLGLDAAGKTTILYRMKLGEVVTTIPTIGFNVETIQVSGMEITCWDVGGRDKIRPLYKHYYHGSAGAVYVLDSADRQRAEDAIHEMKRYFLKEEDVRDTVLMVLANKQDLDGAMTVPEVEAMISKVIHKDDILGQTIFVCPTSGTTGEGLSEAFECFVEHMKLKKAGHLPEGLLTAPTLAKHKEANEKQGEKVDGSNGRSYVEKFIKEPALSLKSLLFY